MNKTTELYESPVLERNKEKYGDLIDQCICCGKPIKDTSNSLMIHMNTDWEAVRSDISDELCLTETGAESQGYFYIGNDCAKKMSKEFIIQPNK